MEYIWKQGDGDINVVHEGGMFVRADDVVPGAYYVAEVLNLGELTKRPLEKPYLLWLQWFTCDELHDEHALRAKEAAHKEASYLWTDAEVALALMRYSGGDVCESFSTLKEAMDFEQIPPEALLDPAQYELVIAASSPKRAEHHTQKRAATYTSTSQQ